MKRSYILLAALLILAFAPGLWQPGALAAQVSSAAGDPPAINDSVIAFLQDEPTPTPTETPTPTASATPTPTATSTPEPTPTATLPPAGVRPVVVIAAYSTKPALVTPGKEFSLDIRLVNQGQTAARNIILTIPAGNFIPLETGGVLAVSELVPGDRQKLTQPLAASSSLTGSVATLEVKISYTDVAGQAFNEAFIIALNLEPPRSGPAATATPTPTPTQIAINRPQLVISSYQTDVSPLQPGTQFTLILTVFNTGNADAKRVTMIAGGASLNPKPGNGEGDPLQPDSFTGSGGEFTNFSPVGVSNVQSLGDLPAGIAMTAQQPLIVNVTTNPGAYSFKISFAYLDAKGNLLIDDQVISLLVLSLPVVEINFYRDPGAMFLGQPNQLPIQIVNLGRKSAVFGNMRVSAPNGQLSNNTIFVGPLEPGGFFPLDATWMPDTPGPVEVTVSVDYTDDFNRPQNITQILTVEVLEAPPIEPGNGPGMGPGESPGGFPPLGQPETFWQKALRFLAGLFGLDSGLPTSTPGEGIPPEGETPPGQGPVGPGPIIIEPPIKGP